MIDPNTGSVIGSNEQLQDFTAPCRELTLSPERDRGTSSENVGILPIAKSKMEFDLKTMINPWGFEWGLPGHGEKYSDCGHWRSRGCMNVDGHSQQGLDEDHAGLIFVKRYQRTCFRAQCPVCYESWAGKEAGKIEYRLRGMPKNKRAIHLVVSPPAEVWIRLSYSELKKRAYVIAKSSGFKGGCCVFHPFRKDESTNQWYFSPHFHMIGNGWIKGTKKGFEAHGWIVKNAGLRKTVSGTALYLLSHAGIHASHHTVTWFGSLSYNNMTIPPKPKEEDLCPICKCELQELWYFGALKLPEEKAGFWLDPEGWEIKPDSQRIWGGG